MVDPGGCVVVGPEGACNIHVCMCVVLVCVCDRHEYKNLPSQLKVRIDGHIGYMMSSIVALGSWRCQQSCHELHKG